MRAGPWQRGVGVLLAASATAWRYHLGTGPGRGSGSLFLCPCRGWGGKGPRGAWKPPDGPGLVPKILPPTYSCISTAQGRGDKSKSWSGITENGENEAQGENTLWREALGLSLDVSEWRELILLICLLSVCSRTCLLSEIPRGPGPHLLPFIAKLVDHFGV